MIRDVCLDTMLLAELLRQYFSIALRPHLEFQANAQMSANAAREINRVVKSHFSRGDEGPPKGLIVASVMAFVEIINQFDVIMSDDVAPWQALAFLEIGRASCRERV